MVLRGNPNKPPAEFLFSHTRKEAVERAVVAILLKNVWSSSLDGVKDIKEIQNNTLKEVNQLYSDGAKGLRALAYFDALPTIYRDIRHLWYHWDHTSYLIEEIFNKEFSSNNNFSLFVSLANEFWKDALTGQALAEISTGYKFRGVVTNPEIIIGIREVDQEYMRFLAHHPDILDKIAWQAFESVVKEVFKSNGCDVKHIGTQWGMSADLIVVNGRNNKNFIIEAKRYSRNRKVDLQIVNAVLGSKERNRIKNNVMAAFLVTSASFTKAVEKERQNLAELNLFLRDGAELKEWLIQAYPKNGPLDTPKSAEEVWLPPNWKDEPPRIL